jgi:hypothetical protein
MPTIAAKPLNTNGLLNPEKSAPAQGIQVE